jgi:hypothetical protein
MTLQPALDGDREITSVKGRRKRPALETFAAAMISAASSCIRAGIHFMAGQWDSRTVKIGTLHLRVGWNTQGFSGVFFAAPELRTNAQRAMGTPSRLLGTRGGVFRRSLNGRECKTLNARGESVMSDSRRADRGIACPRCKAPMDELFRIAPKENDPGLIAYECPSCAYVTSVLVRPEDRRSRPSPSSARS